MSIEASPSFEATHASTVPRDSRYLMLRTDSFIVDRFDAVTALLPAYVRSGSRKKRWFSWLGYTDSRPATYVASTGSAQLVESNWFDLQRISMGVEFVNRSDLA